jgi:hypothetical protein
MAVRSESVIDDTITDKELAQHLTEMPDREGESIAPC